MLVSSVYYFMNKYKSELVNYLNPKIKSTESITCLTRVKYLKTIYEIFKLNITNFISTYKYYTVNL